MLHEKLMLTFNEEARLQLFHLIGVRRGKRLLQCGFPLLLTYVALGGDRDVGPRGWFHDGKLFL